jgi:predicted HTH domain antitoxin
MSATYDDLITQKYEYDKIISLSIYEKTINDFEILYNCINIEKLIIEKCNFEYEKYLNFDFSKFKKLYRLSITKNFLDEYNYEHKKINDIVFEKFDYPEKILNLFSKYLHLKYRNHFIEIIKKRDFNLEYDNERLQLDYIKYVNYYSEILKEYDDYKLEKIKVFPFNKTIFDCNLSALKIDICKIKEFFNKLPDDCKLLNSLVYLDYSCSSYPSIFYNNYNDVLFDIPQKESNSDICKILLFKKLRYNIYTFLNSDYCVFTSVDKNRIKSLEDCKDIDNVVLYYKKKCLLHIIYNKTIELENDIEDLVINIEIKDYAFGNQKLDENIQILDNLPNITNLEIHCTNEYHDNCTSAYDETLLNINNLPFTIKNLKITGIDKNSKIKIPFDCNFECKYHNDN